MTVDRRFRPCRFLSLTSSPGRSSHEGSIRVVVSFEKKRERDVKRKERLVVAIPDENSKRVFSLSLSLFLAAVSFGRVSPGITLRVKSRNGKGKGIELRRGEKGDHVRLRTFCVAGKHQRGTPKRMDSSSSATRLRCRASAFITSRDCSSSVT